MDILTAIGLAGLAKEVLWPLLKGSLEDYTKDFFKDCIADVVGLASQEPVQKATAEALKRFVELVEDELTFLDLSGAEIRDRYEIPLRQLVKDAAVQAVLGKAFEPDCRQIEAEQLAARWQALELAALPVEFEWTRIGQEYVRSVKGILRSSADLRELLALHNQEAMRQGIEALVGIEPDFDLRKYQEGLREQYGRLKLESLDTTGYAYNELTVWRMFIPQDVRPCQEFNPRVYEIPKERLKELQQRGEVEAEELEAMQLEEYRQVYGEQPIQSVLEVIGRTAGLGQRDRAVADYAVILGDPGSGKSTLLQYVALQWAEQPVRDISELAQRPLPLLIELRRYARDRQENRCRSVVEFLHQGNLVCRLNQQRLHEVLGRGEAIALFDGVDEVFDPQLREEVVTDIHRFTNDYPGVQVVVTSRWLGYRAQTLRDAGFQHYMLQELSETQIQTFIQRWHDQTFPAGADKVRKQERLQKAIGESQAIRELAGNPLLLTMMAILNRHQELPRDRPELYNQASRVLLHQWDVERNLIEQRLDPVTIDYADKQGMLRTVADHMQSGEAGLAGNLISAQDLEGLLMAHLQSMQVEKPREIARLMIKQLRERNFILCYLGADNYAFVHRTFLEYFAAWSFVWKFEKTQTLTFEELRDQTFAAHWPEESWREVLRLIAGMLETTFVDKIIAFLLSQSGKNHKFANIFLAADCLSEVRKRTEIQTTSKQVLKAVQALVKFDLDYYYEPYEEETALVKEIRIKAVTTVSTVWADNPETLIWLKSRAQTDEADAVRRAAVEALARGFKDDPDTLPWLKSRAQTDEADAVRRAAVEALARGFKDDPKLFEFWGHCAVNDPFQRQYHWQDNPRQTALDVLVQQYPTYPQTLELLRDRAQNDNDPQLRKWATQQLTRLQSHET